MRSQILFKCCQSREEEKRRINARMLRYLFGKRQQRCYSQLRAWRSLPRLWKTFVAKGAARLACVSPLSRTDSIFAQNGPRKGDERIHKSGFGHVSEDQ